MKKTLCLIMSLVLLLSCASIACFAADAANTTVPQPIYYQNFDGKAATEFQVGEILVKNNSPANLKVEIRGEGNQELYFTTRNKNNQSQTIFQLFELPETVTEFSVFMRVRLDPDRTNWSTSGTSRVGLAYAVKDASCYSYQSLRFDNKDDGTDNFVNLCRQLDENDEDTSNCVDEGTTKNNYKMTLDNTGATTYEMAIVVSGGKIYSYINGKLIRATEDGATSIDYIADGRGVGIYGAYAGGCVDEYRVYGEAFLPEGYDALTGPAYDGDAGLAPLPALPTITVEPSPVLPAPETPLEPAPEAGTVLYSQNFNDITVENFQYTVVKDSASEDLVVSIENGKLKLAAATGTASQVTLQFYELPENVKSFTIVTKVTFEKVDIFDEGAEKSLVGPAYAIKDATNWSNLSLRSNGTYNFTRQVNDKWVSNKTNPEGGSSRNGKFYSVAQQVEYELAMVVTSEGRIRSYINGILQPDNVPYITDGNGIGVFFRYGTFYMDDYVVYAGQYVPEGYDDINGEGSNNDDLYVEPPVTEAPTNEPTNEPAPEVTTAPAEPEATTPSTQAPTTNAPTAEPKKGCGAAVGCALLIPCMAAAVCLCVRRNKED